MEYTLKHTLKEFVLYLVLPVTLALILNYIAGTMFAESMNKDILTLLLIGFPFGIRRMWVWLVPTGRGTVAQSIGILIFDVLVGAVIGWAVLAYKVVTTAVKTVYRLIMIFASGRGKKADTM